MKSGETARLLWHIRTEKGSVIGDEHGVRRGQVSAKPVHIVTVRLQISTRHRPGARHIAERSR